MQISKREITKHRNSYTTIDVDDIITDDVALAVAFEEKDDVKRLGASWNPDPSGKGGHWSVQTNRLNKDCTIKCDLMGDGWGGTICDWLNNHKMIYKQTGGIRSELTKNLTTAVSTHMLETVADIKGNGHHRVQFETFIMPGKYIDGESVNVIKFIDTEVGEESWMLLEKGRELWDSLIAGGYNHTTPQPTESV
jgi:hypothetical protein